MGRHLKALHESQLGLRRSYHRHGLRPQCLRRRGARSEDRPTLSLSGSACRERSAHHGRHAARTGSATAAKRAHGTTVPLERAGQQGRLGGLLNAAVVDQHTGRGSFTLAYLGENLQGEATRVDGSYSGFGRIHSEVLGAPPRANSGQRGIANAFGAKGVNAQCEYVITGPALGTGVCLFSDGAKYQLHFSG